MRSSRRRDPDAYGRGRRQLGLVLAVATVVAAGVLVGAILGRLSATPTPAREPVQRPMTAGVPGPGPAAVVDGIPIGYAHTPEGAAQAAGNYLAALGSRLALDGTKAQAALDRVAEPSARTRLEAGLAASLQAGEGLWGIQTEARQGQHVVLTQTPISYRVDSYTPDEALVRVWLVTSVGVDGRQRLAAFFGIGSATVTWLNDDWRLRAIDTGNREGDVIPACLQTPTETGGVPSKLDGFVPYGS